MIVWTAAYERFNKIKLLDVCRWRMFILVLSQFEVCLFYIYLYNKRLLSLCSMNLKTKYKIVQINS